MLAIRTNSLIEGYHACLKRLAKRPVLNLYLLINLLKDEADRISFSCLMLASNKLGNLQKKETQSFT